MDMGGCSCYIYNIYIYMYIYIYIFIYVYIYKQCALLPIFTAVQTRCAAAFIPSYPSSLAVICLVGLILEPVWLHARKLRPSWGWKGKLLQAFRSFLWSPGAVSACTWCKAPPVGIIQSPWLSPSAHDAWPVHCLLWGTTCMWRRPGATSPGQRAASRPFLQYPVQAQLTNRADILLRRVAAE